MPRDADLISNLAYARSLVKGAASMPEKVWLWRIFLSAADSFNLDRLALSCEVLYLVLSALIIILILANNFRKPLFYIAAAVLVLLIVCSSLLYVQYSKVVIQKQAVVVSEKSDSKFEPFAEATTYFTLYEGESVSVVASEKEWVKIKRPDGKQGWIKAEDLEFI